MTINTLWISSGMLKVLQVLNDTLLINYIKHLKHYHQNTTINAIKTQPWDTHDGNNNRQYNLYYLKLVHSTMALQWHIIL